MMTLIATHLTWGRWTRRELYIKTILELLLIWTMPQLAESLWLGHLIGHLEFLTMIQEEVKKSIMQRECKLSAQSSIQSIPITFYQVLKIWISDCGRVLLGDQLVLSILERRGQLNTDRSWLRSILIVTKLEE